MRGHEAVTTTGRISMAPKSLPVVVQTVTGGCGSPGSAWRYQRPALQTYIGLSYHTEVSANALK